MPEVDAAGVSAALAEFNIQADDFGVDEKSYGYCYWRNKDTGYIVVAPAWGNEYKRQQKKGMEPLNEYGEFLFPYDKRYTWFVNRDPYYLLFLKGGAREFSERQIREHGWDRKPPYRGVEFPQLAGVTAPEEATCPYCRKKMPRLPEAGRLLQNHIQVMHQESSQANQMTEAFAKAQSNLAGVTAAPQMEMMSLLAQSIQSLARAQAEQAERQRATDERLVLVFERLLASPGPAAPAPQPEQIPDSVPDVEAESITYAVPDAEAAMPGARTRKK